jgi:hypothetical protein
MLHFCQSLIARKFKIRKQDLINIFNTKGRAGVPFLTSSAVDLARSSRFSLESEASSSPFQRSSETRTGSGLTTPSVTTFKSGFFSAAATGFVRSGLRTFFLDLACRSPILKMLPSVLQDWLCSSLVLFLLMDIVEFKIYRVLFPTIEQFGFDAE